MHGHLERFGITGFRLGVAAVLFGLTAPQVTIVCMAAGLGAISSGVISLIVCGLAAVLVSRAFAAHLPPGRRILFAVWCILSLVAVYQLGRMSVFMLDAEKKEYAVNPASRPLPVRSLSKPWAVKHNCLTAYVLGAYLAGKGVENIYDARHYLHPKMPTPVHHRIGNRFKTDVYLYPPPFLILPRLLFMASDDFLKIRTFWFALNVLVAIAAIGAMAVWIGGRSFTPYWLALPMVLAAPNLHVTFQIGNAHFFVACLAVLGMLAFEKGRDWTGAALLGFAIVSKLFPVVLLVYLLFRRRWAAVFWTGAAIIAFCLITLLLYGDRPFHAFVDFHLLRLASGEAAELGRYTGESVVSVSAMAVVYKLYILDLLTQFNPNHLADLVKTAFAIMLVMATAFAGWKDARVFVSGDSAYEDERLTLARTWLALLILGQMQSPFLPTVYGNLTVVWLIALFAVPGKRPILRGLLIAMGWLLFALTVPLPIGPNSIIPETALTLLAFLVALLLSISVVIGSWRTRTNTTPATFDAAP